MPNWDYMIEDVDDDDDDEEEEEFDHEPGININDDEPMSFHERLYNRWH